VEERVVAYLRYYRLMVKSDTNVRLEICDRDRMKMIKIIL
jgi:hypothetical protein